MLKTTYFCGCMPVNFTDIRQMLYKIYFQNLQIHSKLQFDSRGGGGGAGWKTHLA